MREPEIRIVAAADVRRAFTVAGDIRTEVAFQNDINALLARFDEVQVPWRADVGPSPTLPASIVSDATPMPSRSPAPAPAPRLRVVEGGVAARVVTAAPTPVAQPSPAALLAARAAIVRRAQQRRA